MLDVACYGRELLIILPCVEGGIALDHGLVGVDNPARVVIRVTRYKALAQLTQLFELPLVLEDFVLQHLPMTKFKSR